MFHFDLEEIKGFLALISLVSLAIRSSCLSNSILSAQVLESLKSNHASKFVGCFNPNSRLSVENWSGLKSLHFYFPIGKSAAGLSAIRVFSFAVLKGMQSLAKSYQGCLNQIPRNDAICVYRFCRLIPQRRVT
ncbi:hypothetical protein CGJ10_23605 [Vibrio parahaemolyticus]|nr:hypothetical protein CGJ10_23605 [Vibrio parahaemolyticus]